MAIHLFQVLLIGCLRILITSGSSPPPTLIPNPLINSGNNGMPIKPNNDVKQDSTASASNDYPQYLVPPIAYPTPATSGQYSPQLQQYQMQLNPPGPLQADPYAEIKSDISTLRDTVMLLSNVMVKQNAMSGRGMTEDQVDQENNGRARNSNSYGNPPPSNNQNNYQNNNNYQNYQNNNNQQGPSQVYQNHNQGNNNYGPGDKAQSGGYDGPPIQIEVYQSKKEYDEPKVIKDAPSKPKPTADTPKAQDTGLASLFPKLSAAHAKVKTNVVAHAERTFAVIKRGIRNALVTGIIVILVRLLPLLWVGLRLIFNAILPLVGISLQGSNAFSLSADTTKTATADTTPAPATRTLISNEGLDEELANLESNLDIFKGRMF